MPRPLSEDKRVALLAAATEAVGALGEAASTAKIAEMAGVSGGTLFVYFPTKDVLLGQLYLELSAEQRKAVIADYPADQSIEKRFAHIWDGMISWGAANPAKQKVLDKLAVSEKYQPARRQAETQACAQIEAIFDEGCRTGILRAQPVDFVVDTIQTLATMVLDRCTRDPDGREHYQCLGWEALWGALAQRHPAPESS